MAKTASIPAPEQDGSWWTYHYEWLPANLLRIEKFEAGHRGEGFQRSLNLGFLKRATQDFNPAMIEPLIVVRVAEVPRHWYSVIDGQHRFHIMQRRHLEAAPCLVHDRELSYQERAGLYVRLNFDRRRLSTEQWFAGRYEEEDEIVLHIIELVEAHGFYIKGFKCSPKPLKRLGCIPTLVAEHRRDASALSTSIRCLEKWAQHDLTYEGQVIRALCALARQDVFKESRMKKVLDDEMPAYVNNLALKLDRGRTRPTGHGFRAAFAELYNKRLSKTAQIAP